MAKTKKKKTADEIVDDVASELGVDSEDAEKDESVEESEAEEAEESEANDDADDADEDSDETSEAEEEEEDDDEVEEEEEAEEEPAPKKAKSKSKAKAKAKSKPKAAATGSKHEHHRAKSIGIFTAGGDDPADSHLGLEDIANFDTHEDNHMPYLVAVIIALVLGCGAIFWAADGDMGNVIALAKGELRERKIAEAKAAEDKFRDEQLAKLEKFGNLMISGNPLYATLRMDGQIQYGQTSTGEWRELQVTPTTAFQNIKVKQAHKLEVEAPGFEPASLDLTEGMWQSATGAQFGYQYVANLAPTSAEAKQELDARLASDTENEFYGAITVATTPPGAAVVFNNVPLTDKDGVLLKTPITFETYFKKDEKTGKLEEVPVRVDSVIDQGNKLQVLLPPEAGKDMPKYVTAVQRQNWTCTWKDEAELKKIKFNAEKDSVQKKCNYAWNLNLDFNALQKYIQDREEEKKRIDAQNKKFQEDMAAMKKELESK